MYSAISAYVSKSRELFKQAARATRTIHNGDVTVIACHAGTKTWHKLPDVFLLRKYGWLARLNTICSHNDPIHNVGVEMKHYIPYNF